MMKQLCFLISVLFTFPIYGQKSQDVTSETKKKQVILISTGVVLYTGTMIGLNELWYKDYPRTSFHFFNDNNEWLQMDKAGHMMTSYYVGYAGKESFEAMGMSRNNSIAWGGSVGLIFLTGIEVLDGFSEEWGFSWGDQLFNTMGAAFFIGQELAWDEQRIKLKFSYSNSPYAQYNPDLLGSTTAERIFKDYNGQTYWASINLHSFSKKENKILPKWLNVAVGYGANGMLGGRDNDDFINSGIDLSLERTRQFYLSLDIDLSQIESNSTFFKTFAKTIGFIKFPAPTFEYNSNGNVNWHWLYF